MRAVETSGKTRKDAVQAALEKLGAELHEVKVEVLDEGSRGFLGIGARDVRVRVSAEGAADDLDETRGNDAGALLQEMIRRMGIKADVTTEPVENGGVRLSIASADSAILIGRKGKTLASLQYLINRMVNTGEDPDKVERIVVDIEGYLERRQEGLEELAHRLAARAKETKRRVRLKPLDPQERRIIHLALQDDPDVETYSVGNAQVRSVVIQPKGMEQLREVPEDREDSERPRERSGPPRGDRDRRGGERRGPERAGSDRAGSDRRGADRGAPRGQGRDHGRDRDRGQSGRRPEGARLEAGPRPEGGRRPESIRRAEGGAPRGEGGARPAERRPDRPDRRPEGARERRPEGPPRDRSEAGARRRGRRGGTGRRPEGEAAPRSAAMTPRSSALMGNGPREIPSAKPVTAAPPEPAPESSENK